MADTFFIVRDDESRHDVATIWNFKRRDWAWDVDAYYLARDGFEYSSPKAAAARVAELNKYTAGGGYSSRPLYTNVRVVNRKELFRLVGTDDHSQGCG